MENLFVPKDFIFQWHITERCNWRCRHCYQESDKLPPDLTLKQLFYIFDQFLFLIKKWRLPKKAITLAITGGEPLIRNDFFEFVKTIGQYSKLYYWNILTNGSFFTNENIKILKEANINIVQLSLEGMERENDGIRGVGAFKKTLDSIRLLAKHNVSVAVSLTLTKKNKEDIFSLAKLLEEMGVKVLGIRRFIPWGRGEELKEFMLQPRELKKCYLKAREINKDLFERKGKIRLGLVCESAIFNEELLSNSAPNMSLNFCSIILGRALVVMANGDILPCRRLPITVGNALRDNIYDVYYSQKMRDFRDLKKLHSFCRKCPSFANCLGGAKCVVYACAGKWNIPDIQCWRAYRKLNEPNF